MKKTFLPIFWVEEWSQATSDQLTSFKSQVSPSLASYLRTLNHRHPTCNPQIIVILPANPTLFAYKTVVFVSQSCMCHLTKMQPFLQGHRCACSQRCLMYTLDQWPCTCMSSFCHLFITSSYTSCHECFPAQHHFVTGSCMYAGMHK